MSEMTLPSRHRIRNALPGCLRPSTLLSYRSGWGRNIFFFFKPPRPGNEPRTLTWKAAVLTTTLGPPPMAGLKPMSIIMHCSWLIIVFVSTIAMITLVISTRTSDKKQCRASWSFFLMASVFVHIFVQSIGFATRIRNTAFRMVISP